MLAARNDHTGVSRHLQRKHIPPLYQTLFWLKESLVHIWLDSQLASINAAPFASRECQLTPAEDSVYSQQLIKNPHQQGPLLGRDGSSYSGSGLIFFLGETGAPNIVLKHPRVWEDSSSYFSLFSKLLGSEVKESLERFVQHFKIVNPLSCEFHLHLQG